jgi:GR25 family glycosyltransferase involved in LPS biosynthesis
VIIIKTAVVLIAYNRPQYLRKVLYSISKAHIIEKFDFFFNVDYDKTTISRNLYLIESFMKKVNRNILAETIKVNNSPLGCGLNHKDAIDRVFNFGYETVICIEDDVMISSDALEFFNQIIKKPDCMIACGFRNHHNFAGYNADQKHDEVCFSERFSP